MCCEFGCVWVSGAHSLFSTFLAKSVESAMANINVKKLMQDEAAFFSFLRSSPQHAAVLSVISSAIDLYHRILPRVVAAHDLGMQQDISLIIRFMKREAHDRVAVRFEHSMLDGVERLFGDRTVSSLLEQQADAIAEHHALKASSGRKSPTMEHLFEKAGAQRMPSWGAEYGRANVSQLLALRLAREEVFILNRQMHRAYFSGDRQESWRLKLRAEEAQRMIGAYSDIASACSMFKMIKEMKGAETALRVDEWVNKNTRITEFFAMRDRIQNATFDGRIYSRSVRKDNRRRA